MKIVITRIAARVSLIMAMAPAARDWSITGVDKIFLVRSSTRQNVSPISQLSCFFFLRGPMDLFCKCPKWQPANYSENVCHWLMRRRVHEHDALFEWRSALCCTHVLEKVANGKWTYRETPESCPESSRNLPGDPRDAWKMFRSAPGGRRERAQEFPGTPGSPWKMPRNAPRKIWSTRRRAARSRSALGTLFRWFSSGARQCRPPISTRKQHVKRNVASSLGVCPLECETSEKVTKSILWRAQNQSKIALRSLQNWLLALGQNRSSDWERLEVIEAENMCCTPREANLYNNQYNKNIKRNYTFPLLFSLYWLLYRSVSPKAFRACRPGFNPGS